MNPLASNFRALAASALRVVFWYDGTAFGGIESALLTFFRACPRGAIQPILVFAGIANDAHFQREVAALGIPAHQLAPLANTRAAKLLRLRSTRRLLKELAPDVVHIQSSGAFTHGPMTAIARLLGIPVVRTIHMPLSGWPQNARTHRGLAKHAHHFFNRYISRTVAVSTPLQDELVRAGVVEAEKCVVIPNGIVIDSFRRALSAAEAKARLGLPPRARVIGAVGRMSIEKGLDQLVDTMPAVLLREPEARLVIVGEGAEMERLRRQIARMELGESVLLLGYRSDIRECMAAFDVFAIPSRFEAQGVVVLEAMAAGRPIVAADLDCFKEMLGSSGAGRLVPAGDSQRFAAALCELLASPETCAAMGRAGVERVQSYPIDSSVAKLLALYAELDEASGAPAAGAGTRGVAAALSGHALGPGPGRER